MKMVVQWLITGVYNSSKGMKTNMKKKLILAIASLLVMNGTICYASESESVADENEVVQVDEELMELDDSDDLLVNLLVQILEPDEALSEEEEKERVEELLSAIGQIITSTIQEDVAAVTTARTEVNEYDLEGAVSQKLDEAKDETIGTIDTASIDTCVTLSALSTSDFDVEGLYALVYADNISYETVSEEFIGTWKDGKSVGGITIGGTQKGLNKLVVSLESLINGTASLTVYNEMNYEESEYGQLRNELSTSTEALKEEIIELYNSTSVVVEFFGIDDWINSLELPSK